MRGYYERSDKVRTREENAVRQSEYHSLSGDREKQHGEPELHIYQENDGGFAVWLNTGVSDFDGLCIGTGETRQAAVQDATNVAERLLETLQGPPPIALVRAPEARPPLCVGMAPHPRATATACCARAGEYNGFASGPLLFKCPKGCTCHD